MQFPSEAFFRQSMDIHTIVARLGRGGVDHGLGGRVGWATQRLRRFAHPLLAISFRKPAAGLLLLFPGLIVAALDRKLGLLLLFLGPISQ